VGSTPANHLGHKNAVHLAVEREATTARMWGDPPVSPQVRGDLTSYNPTSSHLWNLVPFDYPASTDAAPPAAHRVDVVLSELLGSTSRTFTLDFEPAAGARR
jgi:hypothetical protein